MAVASSSAMNNQQDESNSGKQKHDDHDDDMVMPGFRFHPTEEELVEFYLRRKVEGKRFNVELITFLDLYRFDPWELPALAAIGEKEWYFYVPRDRKYRNGDRPNRVTTSGYWKATGADRMIRSENFRSIGLKKTLVFYTGKAPKGVRTSWIMNEYRLPLHETERLQKAEISLCRVYKRAGVDDHHPSLPRSLPTRASSSSSSRNSQPPRSTQPIETFQAAAGVHGGGSSDRDVTSPSSSGSASLHPLPSHSPYPINPMLVPMASTLVEDDHANKLASDHPPLTPLTLNCNPNVDDLHRLVNFNYNTLQQLHNPLSLSGMANHDHNLENAQQNLISGFAAANYSQAQTQPAVALNVFPGPFPAAFSDRLWEWNTVSEANKDFSNNPFK